MFQRGPVRLLPVRTSSDHTLNVSISVAAHTPVVVRAPARRLGIQPVCEILLPKLPTYTTASSSSCSSAFDMHTSPSVDPESRRRGARSSAVEEEGREKCTEVMSSEWVDVCFLSGATGCRGSLPITTRPSSAVSGISGDESICVWRTHQYRIWASSPRSSVPAATVRPSIDTSQDRSALCSPTHGTAGRHRPGFQCL